MSNQPAQKNRLLRAAGISSAIVGFIVLGSWVYWVGKGRPGTSEDFRDRVADTGLMVAWTNNGPRGGDGAVVADCGEQSVSVNDIDGALWLRWDQRRVELTTVSAEAFQACEHNIDPTPAAIDPATVQSQPATVAPATPTGAVSATPVPMQVVEDQAQELASLVVGEGETLVLARGAEVEIHQGGARIVVSHLLADPSIWGSTGNGWVYAEGAFVSAVDDGIRCEYPRTIGERGVVANTIALRGKRWLAQVEQIADTGAGSGSFMVDCESGEVVEVEPFFVFAGDGEWEWTVDRGEGRVILFGDAEGNARIGRSDRSLVSTDYTSGAVLDPLGSMVAYDDHTFDAEGPRAGVLSHHVTKRVMIRDVATGNVLHEVILPVPVLGPLFFNGSFVITELGDPTTTPAVEPAGHRIAAINLDTGHVSYFTTIGVPVLLGDQPVLVRDLVEGEPSPTLPPVAQTPTPTEPG